MRSTRRDVAAEARLALDEVDELAGVGELEGGGGARDAAADDQRVGAHVDGEPLQRLVARDPQHGCAHQVLGLLRRCDSIVVHPAALLADVGHLDEVRVEARRLRGAAERRLVHAGAAGGDHDALELVVGDVLGDHLLPGVGAHVLVRARHHDAGHGRRGFSDGVAVDHLGDVGAAVADEHARSRLSHCAYLLRPHGAGSRARRRAAPPRPDARGPARSPSPSPGRCPAGGTQGATTC